MDEDEYNNNNPLINMTPILQVEPILKRNEPVEIKSLEELGVNFPREKSKFTWKLLIKIILELICLVLIILILTDVIYNTKVINVIVLVILMGIILYI
jgi:undecaprenyl pyrophosphate phosphatase UppP